MTIKKYRLIDLSIMTVIAILADVITGITGFILVDIYVAVSIPILLLCYVRWGKYALIPNALVMIAHVLVYWNPELAFTAAHSLSFIGLTVCLAFPKLRRFTRPRTSFGTTALYYSSAYLTMFLIEWGLHAVLGTGMTVDVILMIHGFNFLFGFGMMAIISRQKDLLIPMKDYLLEEQQVREKMKDKGNGLYDEDQSI